MEDMDSTRVPFGTVADFSKWNMGVKGFEHMKISSSEKIIEPEQGIDPTLKNRVNEIKKEEPKIDSDLSKIKQEANEIAKKKIQQQEKRNIPTMVNPVELKNIAVRLLPSAKDIKPEEYDNVCEKAIDLAYNFLKVWNLKVEIRQE